MKKLVAILLTLIFCLGIFVSCNNETPTETSSQSEGVKESDSEESSRNHEETMTTLDSETESVDISSESESLVDDTAEKVILDGVTCEYFDAYNAFLDKYQYSTPSINIGEQHAKVIFNYEDFLKGVTLENIFEIITEATFDDYFVIVISGRTPVIRSEDIYYTDFKEENDCYTITYNRVYSKKQNFSPAESGYTDVCIIPKSLCNNTTLTEIKIINKAYVFEGQNYNSSCEVRTYLPE